MSKGPRMHTPNAFDPTSKVFYNYNFKKGKKFENKKIRRTCKYRNTLTDTFDSIESV